MHPLLTDILETHRSLGRYQDNEEDVRLFRPVSGTSRGYLPALITSPCSSRPGSRNLFRSNVEEATHLHGAYGRESVPTNEST